MARTTTGSGLAGPETLVRPRPNTAGAAAAFPPSPAAELAPRLRRFGAVAYPSLVPGPEARPGRQSPSAIRADWDEPPATLASFLAMKRPDLESQLATLPASPGVYQFYDEGDVVLYVGKALSLRSRVRSYFHDSASLGATKSRMVERIARVDWLVTHTGMEALLLEMNLIKTHRPRFNVTLKDDKRYPFIKIHMATPFPKVEATRNVAEEGARYFGPYTSASSLYETLDTLRKVFPYLTCNRTITGTDERSCLYDDLGLCAAPCVGKVDAAEYGAMIDRLAGFLQGETQPVVDDLKTQMEEHADRLEFEQAARVRDRIAAIRRVIARQRIIAPTLTDRDVIAVARDERSAVAQVFFVRGGKLIGREYFRLEGTEDEPHDEVLASFIKQFYDGAGQVPGEIVVPVAVAEAQIIEAWLSGKRGAKVRMTVPQRGSKKELMQVALENAAETLRALDSWHATENETSDEAVVALQAALDLPRPPRRIECFDISTLQGTNTVGSMVVFDDAAPNRSDYRRFQIKTAAADDDFACMEEVLTRRFQRLMRHRAAGEEGGEPVTAFERTPDLVLIDGGKGQLAVAEAVLSRLGLDDIPLASLAKKLEELYRPGSGHPVRLPPGAPALHLVQRVRDEAHRFAVTYHRSLRRKTGLASSLDEVPGIGAKRRRALLAAFGSLEGIRAASVEELLAVPTMNRAAAEKVKAFL